MTDPLSRLAILHGTDKFGLHDYTPHYHAILQHYRDRPLRMLEIGVGGFGHVDRGGESLRMRRDYFPQAEITGLDIEEKRLDTGPRIQIRRGSQVDLEFLAETVADRGPFDIILDDGSHLNEHVVASFEALFPTLLPGGTYLAEDVQTAFFARYGGSTQMTAPNSVGYFADRMFDLLDGAAGDIACIERFHNIVVIHKTDGGAQPGLKDDRRLAGLSKRRVRKLDSADAAALTEIVDTSKDGSVVILPGDTNRDLLRQVFAQIDHREIAVGFPDAPIHPSARRILSLAAYRDGIILGIGPNEFPSNFAYDPAQPQAARACKVLDEVIHDPDATTAGLLQYAKFAQRYFGIEQAFSVVDALAERGATDLRYFQLAVSRMRRQKDWDGLIELGMTALRHHPDDPAIVTAIGPALQRDRRLDEAEALLRKALIAHPRQRGVMVALAQVLEQKDGIDEAIGLYATSVTLFQPQVRQGRLLTLMRLADRHGRGTEASDAAQQLLKFLPDDDEVKAVVQKYRSAPT